MAQKNDPEVRKMNFQKWRFGFENLTLNQIFFVFTHDFNCLGLPLPEEHRFYNEKTAYGMKDRVFLDDKNLYF